MARLSLRSDILLASPSDVRPRVDELERAIVTWNAMHSDDWSVVFRPVRWERDVVPAWGLNAQDCINNEIVDSADGMFALLWHRLGVPTATSISGTVEEIERFAAAGKRPGVYLCTDPMPANVDVEQLKRLREYQESLLARGLVFEFSKPEELQTLCHHYLSDLARLVLDQHRQAPHSDELHGGWNEVGDVHVLGDALQQMVYLRRQLEVLPRRVARMGTGEQAAAPALKGSDWERCMILFEEAAMRLPEAMHQSCKDHIIALADCRAYLLRSSLQAGPSLREVCENTIPEMIDLMLAVEDSIREAIAAHSESYQAQG